MAGAKISHRCRRRRRATDDFLASATTIGGLLVTVPRLVALYVLTGEPPPCRRALLAILYPGMVGSVLGFVLYYYVPHRVEANLERRIYFLAGDVLANGLTGMAAAWLAVAIADPSWPMPVAMLAGMFAAMALALVLMPPFVGLFGAMEVMLPVMLSAMLAGMVFGMAGALPGPAMALVLAGGAALGILALLFTYGVDALLHGRRA